MHLDRWWFPAALAVEFAAYIALALYFLWHADVNLDESWYLGAGRLVYEGKVPYRDFAFFQAPLSAYIYGLSQVIAGQGLLSGRATTFVFGIIAVAAGTRVSWLCGGRLGALLFLPLFALSRYTLLGAFSTVRTEPLTATFLLLAAWVLLERLPAPFRWASANSFLALATITRISVAPVLAIVFCIALYRMRGNRWFVAGMATGAVIAAIAAALFVARAGLSDVRFNVLESQTRRHAQYRLDEVTEFSVRVKFTGLAEAASEFPVTFLAGVAGLAAVGAAGVARSRGRRDIPLPVRQTAILVFLGWTVYAAQFVPRWVWPEYFVPSAAVFAALGASLMARLAARSETARIAAPILAALLSVQLLQFYAGYVDMSDAGSGNLGLVRSLGTAVRDVTPAGKTVVTLDSLTTLESGRRMPVQLTMGVFGYWPRIDFSEAQEHKIVTDYSYWWLISHPDVATVVLSDLTLTLVLEGHVGPCRPSEPLSADELKAAIPELAGFELARVWDPDSKAPFLNGPFYFFGRQPGPPEPSPPLPVGWTRPTCKDLVEHRVVPETAGR